jgi:hypothetical protein
MQEFGPRIPLSSDPFTVSGENTRVLRGVVTTEVDMGEGRMGKDTYDSQFYRATARVHDDGCMELDSGQLYISGVYTERAVARPAIMPFPMVVKKLNTMAGSVGTHWFIWVEPDVMWIVLLDSPGGPPGKVRVRTTLGETVREAEITAEDHFLQLPSFELPNGASQVPLVDGPSRLQDAVNGARQRCRWPAGFRP